MKPNFGPLAAETKRMLARASVAHDCHQLRRQKQNLLARMSLLANVPQKMTSS